MCTLSSSQKQDKKTSTMLENMCDYENRQFFSHYREVKYNMQCNYSEDLFVANGVPFSGLQSCLNPVCVYTIYKTVLFYFSCMSLEFSLIQGLNADHLRSPGWTRICEIFWRDWSALSVKSIWPLLFPCV